MDFISEWATKDVPARQKLISDLIDGPLTKLKIVDFIDLVKVGHWGVYASNGPHFRSAIFGRDSLTVAEDMIDIDEHLAHDIIMTLARLQGVKFDAISEEEIGKIHHEYRTEKFENIPIDETSMQILHDLQKKWGGVGTSYMVYYGSHDASLLYVRLVNKFIRRYGEALLSEEYITRDHQTKTIKDSLVLALGWIEGKIKNSYSGLLEYKRLNPDGLYNQAWKDSITAYLNSDGSMPNFDNGIASIELQGYAYDALYLSAESLIEHNDAKKWRELALQLQGKTLELLWMKDKHYFAQGLYKDKHGKIQQIDTLTSNPGLLLDSLLLKNLPESKRQYYVDKVVKVICGKQFMTAAGIRSRSTKHFGIPAFIDYHGSYTVWPRETNAIARGLRSHGYHNLATQLEHRLLSAVLMSGEFYEFYYAEQDNKVWYDHLLAIKHFNAESPGGHIPVPEPGQAWTISAVLRILSSRIRNKHIGQNPLERQILAQTSQINLPRS